MSWIIGDLRLSALDMDCVEIVASIKITVSVPRRAL
jgi:hypothetical protein